VLWDGCGLPFFFFFFFLFFFSFLLTAKQGSLTCHSHAD
jgi:hypothetical protein